MIGFRALGFRVLGMEGAVDADLAWVVQGNERRTKMDGADASAEQCPEWHSGSSHHAPHNPIAALAHSQCH
jgi:hypothetical protein